MCGAHYQRALKYGDPLAGGTPKGELERWLRAHANYSGDDCLKWPFGTKGNGYGHLAFNGRKTSASNAMCELAHGSAPSPAHEAAHSCGNGHAGCVNPSHLRWATRLENVHDAMRDGTTSRGAAHSNAIKAAFASIPRAVRREAKWLDVPVETLVEEAKRDAA
jgi:hypothetical protein